MNTAGTIQVTDKLMAGLQGFVTLVNDPHQIKAFYDLHEALQQTQPMRSFEHYMLSIPEIAQLVEERYTPPASSLKQLNQLPEGSLGRVHATRMIAAGLDPDAIQKNATAVENWEAGLEWKASYLTQRRAMTHDIHHTVTNFGTDLPGEVGLSAVYLAQIHQPVSLLYLAAVLLHAMAKSQEYKQALQALSVGLEMGQQARNLLAQKWETGWERPLSEWREKLSIAPIAV